MNITGIASGIWETEFDSYSGMTVSSIAASLCSYVGRMNILINQSFSVDSTGGFDPSIGSEEEAILTQIYLERFYAKEARKVLRGISDSSSIGLDWTELREGDSVIKRNNKSEVSKTLFGLSKDAKLSLDDLVHNYNMYNAAPRQVAGDDADA